MSKLVVAFYNMDTDEHEGQGYYMPNKEVFEDYVVNELKAVKIADNKYKHPNPSRNSYVRLEQARY
ncbi:hypothetical protein BCB4_0125 [Bacillus phage B4]|uniref:Uncharacterized protein n=2 Tax=Bequatrovirus B4 TaxID=1918005 RepID=J9PRT3_9CAUD|nr:hypothetical protein BCB4_0125 [Bacillus phage B4]YP_009783717.1 hypothetical protein QLX26_gp121 [Bacillus phage B5S]MEB9013979.1 hypothetical protein [Bacillus cereus]AEW47355.1 hypothetical protein B5S_0121 [Bacillus phage B5S]AEZ65918.1 hypothetical protein BCB4_0125 [Bacillus phage B4]MEB9190674.1 hypothetical protein [Bacillus cereus]